MTSFSTTHIQAVIFDMDGLMIDSEGKQSQAIEQTLREHGAEPIPDPATGVVQVVGMRARDNLHRLKEQHKLTAPLDVLHGRKNEIYRQMLAEGVEIMPGLLELLADLAQTAVKKSPGLVILAARHRYGSTAPETGALF